jgi:hypothetical protein
VCRRAACVREGADYKGRANSIKRRFQADFKTGFKTG